MGNSPFSGLGSGSAHGLRDVRTANPETEVERPQASPEPNENLRDLGNQLPVPPKPYTHSVEIPTKDVGFLATAQATDAAIDTGNGNTTAKTRNSFIPRTRPTAARNEIPMSNLTFFLPRRAR